MNSITIVASAILFALLIGWINSKKSKDTLANASETFINIFTTELEDLYPAPKSWPDDVDLILQNKFKTLHTAVYHFKKALPWHQQMSFSKSWEKFHNPADGGTDSKFNHYSVGDDKQERFKKDVDEILSFAKYN